jgi:hypothetical protein
VCCGRSRRAVGAGGWADDDVLPISYQSPTARQLAFGVAAESLEMSDAFDDLGRGCVSAQMVEARIGAALLGRVEDAGGWGEARATPRPYLPT